MGDWKEYVDLKADEIKLQLTRGLSTSLGRLTAVLLAIGLLLIVLALLAVVIIQWLAQLTGSMPLSTSIVCGVFLIVLALVFFLRKRLFRNTFVRLFIQIFYGDGKEEG